MIQDHVVSLDLAKQLVEAGIVVESEFAWDVAPSGISLLRYGHRKTDLPYPKGVYPAPLSSELGEFLPKIIEREYGNPWLSIHCDKYPIRWYCSYVDLKGPRINQSSATMPDAMAKMLLYLKEKGLL